MFTNAGLGLKAHGLTYRNVVRTWIYVARLLEWYDDFNRVRTAHYRLAGFGVEGGAAFPASTGIQGHYEDEECLWMSSLSRATVPQALRRSRSSTVHGRINRSITDLRFRGA